MQSAALCLVLAVGTSAGIPAMAQALPKQLVLATVEDSYDTYTSINVLKEAYSRLGIDLEIRHYPGDISIRNANEGEVDGDVQRIDGILDQFPNLVQVQIPINYFEIAIFSTDPSFKPRGWFDVRTKELGIVRGIIAAERATEGMSVRMVDTYDELIALLGEGDVDVIASPVINTDVAMLRGEVTTIQQNAIMDTFLLYHYLHKDRAHILPALEPVLKEMLLDGTISRIRKKTSEEILRRKGEMD